MRGPELLLRYLHAKGDVPIEDEGFVGLVDSAQAMGLEGALYAALKRRGHTERVSAERLQELRRMYAENAAFAMELLRHLKEIEEALARAGAQTKPLKGAVLLEAGIDPGTRYCLDLDILTRPSERAIVHEALRVLGFVTTGTGGAPKHLPVYKKGTLALEVHEYAFWNRGGRRWGLDELLEEQEPLAFALVHLTHHLHVSSVATPELAMKTIGDAVAILGCAHDVDALERRGTVIAREAGLEAELGALLAMARSVVGGELLEERSAALADLCETPSEAGLLMRELKYYAGAFLRSPPWYRRALMKSILAPPEKPDGEGALPPDVARAGPLSLLRPFQLAVRTVSRLSRALIRGRTGG